MRCGPGLGPGGRSRIRGSGSLAGVEVDRQSLKAL
jgi:hypothetical protein